MPSHLDFFLDFAMTGQVFGAGLGTRPEAWPAVLGADFTDFGPSEHELARQFGLIDVYFEDFAGEWVCDRISIRPGQLYRFDDWVPVPVTDRYGPFPGRVPFDEVADRLTQAGVPIDHVLRRHEAELEEYWIPDTKVMFSLISLGQAEDFPALRIGDLWNVSTSVGAEIPDDRRERYRSRSGGDRHRRADGR
jgi:hypothetical protein